MSLKELTSPSDRCVHLSPTHMTKGMEEVLRKSFIQELEEGKKVESSASNQAQIKSFC